MKTIYLIIPSSLLKDLAVGPFVLLPVNLDRLIPSPHILNKFHVLGITGVQLCELVALVVRRNVECRFGFFATDQKGTFDDGIIGFSVNRGSAEDVFTGRFKAGEESSYIGRSVGCC